MSLGLTKLVFKILNVMRHETLRKIRAV